MGKKRQKSATPVVGERPFLHVQLRVFAHATEDADKVRDALALAAGFDLGEDDDEKRFDKITKIFRAQGHFNNPITIRETEISRNGEIRRFWENLFTEPGVKERLGREVDERLDEDLVFWLRLDKQSAYQGDLKLTAGEDVILVRAKLATYPKDRAVGLDFLRTFLDGKPASTT